MRIWMGLAVLLGCGCGGNPAPPPPLPLAAQAVRLVRPTRREVHRTVELPAEARPWREARLHAKVSGLLKEVHVDIGDRVREGQLLARLEVPESGRQVEAARAEAGQAEQQRRALQLQALAEEQQRGALEAEVNKARWQARSMQAQADESRAELRLHQATLQRLQGIYTQDPGLIAYQQIDEARAQVESQQARVRSLDRQVQASLHQARALQQQSQAGQSRSQALGAQGEAVALEGEARWQDQLKAQDWLAYSEIRAPFAGVISRRHLHPGALVQSSAGSAQGATQPMLELVDDRRLRVTTQVPESEAPHLQTGHRAWVRVDAFPEEVFEGRVSRLAGVIGSDRCMQAEVELDNAEGRLRSGMFVRLTLSLQVHPGVLAVPSHSLLDEKGKFSLFLADGGKARKQPVQIGFRNRDWTEIREGLKGDEEVVDEGRERLVEGTPLEVRP